MHRNNASAISPLPDRTFNFKEHTDPTIGYALYQGKNWCIWRDSHAQPTPYKEFALKLSYRCIGGP